MLIHLTYISLLLCHVCYPDGVLSLHDPVHHPQVFMNTDHVEQAAYDELRFIM